jgi:hypothetical protein
MHLYPTREKHSILQNVPAAGSRSRKHRTHAPERKKARARTETKKKMAGNAMPMMQNLALIVLGDLRDKSQRFAFLPPHEILHGAATTPQGRRHEARGPAEYIRTPDG